MALQLAVVAGADKGRTVNLEEGTPVTIGRGREVSFQIQDLQVSRNHCVVQIEGRNIIVMDNQSRGGTFINGEQVQRQEMKPGDILRVGGTELRLVLHGESQETTIAPSAGAKLAAPAPASLRDLVGKTISNFRITKVLAKGHSGMVFKAVDEKNPRDVALKVLWPENSQHEDELQRFIRAMKTMLPIKHENIIEIYAAGKNGPYCWVAMEYVDGESLTEVIRRIGTANMLDWRNAFRVCVHMSKALQTAFEHQIIHRNITPQNILVRHADKVTKLGDLMLAKALEGTQARQVTQPGQLVGDLAFMSPERTKSDGEVDWRSDVYGLGATVYALLTGRPPCEGESLPELVNNIRKTVPEKPKKFQLAIADRFQDVVMTMLQKRPEDRYQEPGRLLEDLRSIARYENLQFS